MRTEHGYSTRQQEMAYLEGKIDGLKRGRQIALKALRSNTYGGKRT